MRYTARQTRAVHCDLQYSADDGENSASGSDYGENSASGSDDG